jgi:EAL domain-containing protein (putative c-di-GMP-specific phosphodiesterase class I)
MLKMLPVDELKIDKSFVDNITNNKIDYSLLHTIISLGKQLNINVVAEGIETQEQLAILKNARCDVLQGYYFSKPMKIADLEIYIKNNSQRTKEK